MSRRVFVQAGYLGVLALLLGQSFLFAQPNAALTRVLYGGAAQDVAITTVMSAAVYLAVFSPAILFGTRKALVAALALVAVVAFGPRALAELTAWQQTTKAQETDRAPVAYSGDVRIVEIYDLPCQQVCRALLATGQIEAVRSLNQYGVVEAYVQGPDGLQRVEDRFGPGDITIARDGMGPDEARREWGAGPMLFAETLNASRVTISAGSFADRAEAPILYRKTDLSHALPVAPTLFRAPTHGWTSGGNRGGVTLARLSRWQDSHSEAEQLRLLATIGLDVAPAPAPRD